MNYELHLALHPQNRIALHPQKRTALQAAPTFISILSWLSSCSSHGSGGRTCSRASAHSALMQPGRSRRPGRPVEPLTCSHTQAGAGKQAAAFVGSGLWAGGAGEGETRLRVEGVRERGEGGGDGA